MSGSFFINPSKLEIPRDAKGGPSKQNSQATSSYAASPNQNIGHPEMWHKDNDKLKGWFRKWWLPYVNSAHMWDNFRGFLRSMVLEFVFSFVLQLVVSIMVSTAISGDYATRGFMVGFSQLLTIYVFYSIRHATLVPRHLSPAISFSEWLHDRIGLVVMFSYMISQYGGALLAGPLLTALGGAAVPNYLTTLRPISTSGAVLLDLLFGTFVNFVYLHNQPMDVHTYQLNTESNTNVVGLHRVSLFTGAAYMISTMITFPNGLYLHGNPIMYVGAAVSLGSGNVPTAPSPVYWVYPVFIGGVVCGLLAWALHLLSWNMNGLSAEQFSKYAEEEWAKKTMQEGKINAFISESKSRV